MLFGSLAKTMEAYGTLPNMFCGTVLLTKRSNCLLVKAEVKKLLEKRLTDFSYDEPTADSLRYNTQLVDILDMADDFLYREHQPDGQGFASMTKKKAARRRLLEVIPERWEPDGELTYLARYGMAPTTIQAARDEVLQLLDVLAIVSPPTVPAHNTWNTVHRPLLRGARSALL